MKRLLLLLLSLSFLAAAFLVLLPPSVLAQETDDPIMGSAPIAPWSLVLEDVLMIPDSAGEPALLEFLISNPTTGLNYVVDQRGFVYTFDSADANPTPTLFLDLATSVGNLYSSRESGVRGLAFHPDFDVMTAPGYRKMYMSLSRSAISIPVGTPAPILFDSPGSTNHFTVIAEWTLLADGSVDVNSYREMMRIEQPFTNHSAGHLLFNPTAAPGSEDYGKLYIGLADGGSGGDPFNLSQDIDATPIPYPYGKILRIDPIAVGGAPYTIPPDNPFAGIPDRLEETWAYGLRNPHKFTWDIETGVMYVSDIGQGVVEEINIVTKGANYGWNVREGAFVYSSLSTVSPLPADHFLDVYSYPVAQYDHQNTNGIIGSSAVVGGPVYRGSQIPELYGFYFFSGFPRNPGPIFAVHVDELVERSNLTNLLTLNAGRIAPFVEVKIRHDNQKKDFRQFLRDVNSDPGIMRTDARWGVGIDGEIYLLNKNDGVVRRISGIFGVPGVPALGTSGLVILSGLLAAAGAMAIGARRRFGESNRT